MEFRDKPMQNLIRVKEKEICKNVQELLLDGEQIVGAYKTVRDQAVFTSHRIFIVDMQGVTGTRQEIFVLPYRKIVHFGIQTAGFGDDWLYRAGGTAGGGKGHQPLHPVKQQSKRKARSGALHAGAGLSFCCNM